MLKKLKYSNKNLKSRFSYIKYNSPTTVFIKITSKCMLKCWFCSQGDAENCEINIKDVKMILKKLKKENVLRVFYTGGEPFLYSKLRELLEYGSELGFCQMLITNGYMLNNKKIDCFFKYINGISISLHGSKVTHNMIVGNKESYDNIIKGIEHIKQNYPEIALDICYTATQDNTNDKDLTSVADLCRKYEIPLNVTRMYNIGKACNTDIEFDYINKLRLTVKELNEEGYDINIGHCLVQCDEFKDSTLNSFCMAGIDFCAIDINGDIKICSNSMKSIGNIYKEDFKRIWKRNQRVLNNRIKKLPLSCQNCENINKCLGGCKTEIELKDLSLNDALAARISQDKWDRYKIKKVCLRVGAIKRIGINNYLIIGKKIAIVNKNVVNILNAILPYNTLEENFSHFKGDYNYFDLKNLFILLLDDGFFSYNE